MIRDAAVKAPLAPEPFLIRGVEAQTTGDLNSAGRAFGQAQWRDPRSLPAAYFLADYYFRQGSIFQALREIALLARLSPEGTTIVTPYLAAFAKNPHNWAQIRALFRSHSELEDGVLAALARDPSNARTVLAIADAAHRRSDSIWLPILLNSLVASGEYLRAYAIWSVAAHPKPKALLYDGDFVLSEAPPPFNWNLASSTVGLAERSRGSGLHVIFYGHEDGVLASELLLLTNGTFHLRVQLTGSITHPELLRWSIRCDKVSEPAASMGIAEAARGWTFQVPANCPAQWLELSGRSGEIAHQSEATIGDMTLTRAGSNA